MTWQKYMVCGLGMTLMACGAVRASEFPVTFGTTDRGVELTVDNQPVVVVLQAISEATGIPIRIDASMTNHLNGVYRKRDLESLLSDISPGLMISYRYDPAVGDHVIDEIFSAGAADPIVRDTLVRDQIITEQDLIDRLNQAPPRRPVRYSGIGAAIVPADDGQGIWLRPLSPASPAAKNGIELGDLLLAVDDRPIAAFTNLMEVSAAIRGPERTEVSLTIRQPNGTTQTKRIRREQFTWQPPPEVGEPE